MGRVYARTVGSSSVCAGKTVRTIQAKRTAGPTQRAAMSLGRLRRFGRSQRPPLSCYLTGWKENVAVTLVPVSLMLLAVTPE